MIHTNNHGTFCALCFFLCTFLLFSKPVSAADSTFYNENEWEVLTLTNKERMKEGLAPLSTFPSLQSATDIRKSELLSLFSHTRPNGSSCFSVFSELSISYLSAGENIAGGYLNAEAVVNGWMNSTGHRANILTDDFTHMGVGYLNETRTDCFPHQWVQLFVGGCTSSDFQIQFPDEPILVPVETTTPVTPALAATPTPLPVATPSPQSTATPVNKKSIKSATFSKIGTKTYTGKAITPSLIVKGKGNYTGTKKLTFKIKKASITKASISKIKTKKYTGKAIKPTPVITYQSAKLKKNKDFTLSYKSNKKAGTASIKITGTGNFYGTKTITFQIK